jgi:hypothetical protein
MTENYPETMELDMQENRTLKKAPGAWAGVKTEGTSGMVDGKTMGGKPDLSGDLF